MRKLNMLKAKPMGVWGRLRVQARLDQERCGRLWDAVLDMHFEEAQRVLGSDPVGFGFAEERKTA